MSWTDKIAIEDILKLKDEFSVNTFIETGAYMGINAELHSQHFNEVFTCELIDEYYKTARKRLTGNKNAHVIKSHSPQFLKDFKMFYRWKKREDTVLFYLDAHFYNPELPADKRFVVLDELESLRNFNHGILVIHDFDNGQFGHITYDGQPLNFDLLKEKLNNVNPNFRYYTNTECDVFDETSIFSLQGITLDDKVMDNITYAQQSETKRDRGILYCLPYDIDATKYRMRKL
jgi:hypothetical protein